MNTFPSLLRVSFRVAAVSVALAAAPGCGGTFDLPAPAPVRARPSSSAALLTPRELPPDVIAVARSSGPPVERARAVAKGLADWAPALYPQSARFVPMPPAAFASDAWSEEARRVTGTGQFSRQAEMASAPARVKYLMGVEAYAAGLASADPDEVAESFARAERLWTSVAAAAPREAGCQGSCVEQLRAASSLALHFIRVPEVRGNQRATAAWQTSLERALADASAVGALDELETLQLGAMARAWANAKPQPVPATVPGGEDGRQFLAAFRLRGMTSGEVVGVQELAELLDLVAKVPVGGR